MIDAAAQFDSCRLPELFGGNARTTGAPAYYPIACQPQAWAAGAIPFMITSLLGLKPKAFEKKLQLVRPILPDGVNSLEIKNLNMGEAAVDLFFERQSDRIATRVTKLTGDLEVVID
jgi:glycogen debranching enzyme